MGKIQTKKGKTDGVEEKGGRREGGGGGRREGGVVRVLA